MENAVKNRLETVRFGEVQSYRNIAVLPLISSSEGVFEYLALGQALEHAEITVQEVSAGGSVPELLVINRAGRPVLLVDGEELAGAKQNRVLNTSILVKEAAETRVPVSCTEQGRWSYASATFAESGHIMAHKSRSKKVSSVSRSLADAACYSSDQGEVWSEIEALSMKAHAHSPTHAMSDVFKARENDLRQCDETFKVVPGQAGLLVLIDGVPVGLDMVSRSSVYARIHGKLVRSYALEGLLEGKNITADSTKVVTQGRKILEQIFAARESKFPSIGYGIDHRYEGSGLAGTALVHENEIIHAAFFRLDETTPATGAGDMASLRSRKRWSRRSPPPGAVE